MRRSRFSTPKKLKVTFKVDRSHSPFFSIVVPTYARRNQLARCLTAIGQLDYPASRYEVIVVDDGSPQSVADVVDALRPRVKIKLVTQRHSGPAAARNTGAAHASGQFLAFTDDDCRPGNGWLRSFAETLSKHPQCLLGGCTDNGLTCNIYAVASQMLTNYLYQYNRCKSVQTRFFTSNNLALSAELFRQLGGFDETFPIAAGEDRDFCDRWQKSRRALRYVPTARVGHYHDSNARKFWRQHFNYGRGNYLYHKRRLARAGGRNRLESWRFYRGMLATPWKAHRGVTAGYLTVLLLLSQVGNASGYFWTKGLEKVAGRT